MRREHLARSLPLAAFLRLKGHSVIRFDRVPDQPRFFNFVFEAGPDIDADRAAYFNGATVSALEFYEAMKRLRQECKSFEASEKEKPDDRRCFRK